MRKSIKATLGDHVLPTDLLDLGVELETGKNGRGRCAALSGSEGAIRRVTHRAERRKIAAQFRKLGGKILNLCEPCEWLTLGSSTCKKCAGAS
jgi:hypothetical protein